MGSSCKVDQDAKSRKRTNRSHTGSLGSINRRKSRDQSKHRNMQPSTVQTAVQLLLPRNNPRTRRPRRQTTSNTDEMLMRPQRTSPRPRQQRIQKMPVMRPLRRHRPKTIRTSPSRPSKSHTTPKHPVLTPGPVAQQRSTHASQPRNR